MANNIILPFFIISVFLLSICKCQLIKFDVQEETGNRVSLGNIAERANITSLPELGFSLLSQDYQDLFEVDSATGEFRTKARLDREQLCGSIPSCVLTVSVAVTSKSDFIGRYTVEVTVIDDNDQRPTFPQDRFTKAISESSRINTTYPLPVADDADYLPFFKVQSYRLEPESQTTFDLLVETTDLPNDRKEFEVYLRLKEKLDREDQSSYSLTLVAMDGTEPDKVGKLPIEITVTDENDNEPKFAKSRYIKTVNEVTKIGDVLFTVSAQDKDEGENGRVSYRFSYNIDKSIEDYFAIDSNIGTITLIRSLETQGGSKFSFRVTAFDHGSPALKSEAEVEITVEDTVNDPPSISVSPLRRSISGEAAVKEDAEVGATVALVDVTDTDSSLNGQTRCTATSEFFNMRPGLKTGEYKIVVAKALNREINTNLTVRIDCEDFGTPPLSTRRLVTVLVEDVNDHRPVFTRSVYLFSVKENQEAREPVGQVEADDEDEGINAMLRYALGSNVTQFEIDAVSGRIYTAVKNLDRESRDSYTFPVYAYDISPEPFTSTATVIVKIEDLNDVWPRFENSSYTFRVSETTSPNQVIGSIFATDDDLGLGGVVEYLMVHSPLQADPPFSVSQSDGTVTLTEPLDHETAQSYHFLVRAVDQGTPPRNSSVDVHIIVVDENDNSPVITFPTLENISVTLNLDVTPGHEIIRVMASDLDSGENGRLTYSMVSPNTSMTRLFWINQETGQLKLAAALTPADVRTYNVVISVHDNGEPQQATQALLQIEVVHTLPRTRSSDTNTTIVIIMVCVTLVVAVIVLVTLCFIKYVDKKKFDKSRQQPSKYPAADSTTYPYTGSGDQALENGMVVSPALQKEPLTMHQKQPLASVNHNRNTLSNGKVGKKSVTFDSEVRSSDTSSDCLSHNLIEMECNNLNLSPNIKPGSCSPSPLSFSQDMALIPTSTHYSSNSGGNGGVSTLPPSYPSMHQHHPHHQLQQQQQFLPSTSMGSMSCEESTTDADVVVDVALQKHNALVRSMRGNSRRPHYGSRQNRAGVTGRDTDLCSSSSVETTDSGHGGSELDVSALKVSV